MATHSRMPGSSRRWRSRASLLGPPMSRSRNSTVALLLDVRRLVARVEAPAERVIAVRKNRWPCRLMSMVERSNSMRRAKRINVASADLAADEGQGHRQLHFASAAEHIGDVLLLRDGIAGEDVHRPAAS